MTDELGTVGRDYALDLVLANRGAFGFLGAQHDAVLRISPEEWSEAMRWAYSQNNDGGTVDLSDAAQEIEDRLADLESAIPVDVTALEARLTAVETALANLDAISVQEFAQALSDALKAVTAVP